MPLQATHSATSTQTTKIVSIDSGSHRERVIARRNKLVEEHLDLVRQIAEVLSRRLPPSFDMSDLMSAGNMGLMKAAIRYRPSEHDNVPFRIYARHVIRGAIIDAVNRRHYQENTRPSIDEIGEELQPWSDEAKIIDISIDRERRLARIRDAMNYLDSRKRAILSKYYGDDAMTFEAAGAAVGLSRSHAGELHAEAIGELRRILHVA